MMLNLETLTEQQAREIEAGTECDRLVNLVRYGPINAEFAHDEHPSTDANAAIEAAEATGLIGDAEVGKVSGGAWDVRNDEGAWYDVESPTFPLAICRAILVRYMRERDKQEASTCEK